MSKSTPSVETILAQAVEIAEPAQRQGFVEQACGGDAALQRRVEQMVANHFQAGSFLERPAVALDPCATVGWGMTQSASGVGTVIGPYRLLEQIGEGGMGLVFVAEQHEPIKRRVALKIIKPGMDSQQVIARFEAERQALALMDHPHIAKVHDGGTTRDGRPYFVMELVRGTPITDYCDTHCLTTRQRLELFRDVCQAVQHAHQKGIIHRDLKPSNVLVSRHDVTPVVKVIDFGIAKATSGKLTDKTVYTAFAQMVGTPLYMSPEQAGLSDLDVDTRSDVYSLGVLLYEMLTGTTPFESETLKQAGYDEMRRIIREDEPLRPSARLSTIRQADLSTIAERRGLEPRRLSQQLRGDLDRIVMKALEKDRNRRYESASALAADVQRHLNDEPVQACPPSVGYRLVKFARRNKTRVTMAGLVLFFLVLVGGGVCWLAIDQAARHRGSESRTLEALAGARTAIEAGDLALAGRRVAEAQGHLGAERSRSPALAAEIDRFQHELDARQADETRFRQFLKLASEGQDKMGYGGGGGEDSLAREALNLYGVLEQRDWSTRLEDCYLTADQKNQVRETAYVTLVTLADFVIRWNGNLQSSQRSLEMLERAQAFHPPTRAFYYVRSECHRHGKDPAATDEDVKRFKATAAQTAWDYYLPGHTAGWRGDLKEAIRSYRAALALQPNHYNSLFFLADRMARDEIKRWPEAIQLFTGCIALRPHHIFAYISRAECHQKLGQLDEAEADYSAAIAAAESETDRMDAYDLRGKFYEALGRTEEARQDVERMRAAAEQWLEKQKGTPDDRTLRNMVTVGQVRRRAGLLREAIALLEPTVEKCKAKLGPDHFDTLRNMNELGIAYTDVGRLPEAIALLKEALEKSKAKLGPDHHDTLANMNNLGAAYHKASRLPEAIALLKETLEKCKAKLSPDDPLIVLCMNLLGIAYTDVGRLPEAIALLKEALEKCKAKLGPDHPDTLANMNNLGLAYQKAGRLPEAIALFEERLKKRKAGPDLVVMGNLGGAYLEAGRLPEAIALLKEALEKRKAKLGPDHSDTLTNMNNLGLAYQKAGRLPEAIALFEETLKKRKADPDHPELLVVMVNLGRAYLQVGRLPEAIALLKETLEKRKAKLGPDHSDTLTDMNNLGLAYQKASQLPEAITLFEESLKKLKAKLGPDHPDTLTSMNNLGTAYLEVGRLPEALALLEESLEKSKAKLGPDHRDTLRNMNNLGAAYHKASRLPEAIALLKETLENCKAKLGPDHSDTLTSMNNLGLAYEEAGRLPEAIALLKEMLKNCKAKLGPDHPYTLSAMQNLASSYQTAGKFNKAEPLSLALLEHVRKKTDPKSAATAGALARLGLNMLKQQRYVEAEPILRECLAIRAQKMPDDWLRYNTQSLLGDALLGQKKYADAEPLLLEGYEGMKQREARIPPQGKVRLTEAVERIVRLYEASAQPDKARAWREKVKPKLPDSTSRSAK